ncbi:hypothetical protein PR048_003520 [Dryococelus australis]|uniref:Uncharacterized protein n=1 Tax=Dryococelus australis TaxID=614101 RepID=A0ABQ9IN83_9NEOP|nr:hypothetical protein PR048_003520 [Dryococelus australis]
MRVIQVSMEPRRKDRVGKTEDPRENLPTSGIVWHYSHIGAGRLDTAGWAWGCGAEGFERVGGGGRRLMNDAGVGRKEGGGMKRGVRLGQTSPASLTHIRGREKVMAHVRRAGSVECHSPPEHTGASPTVASTGGNNPRPGRAVNMPRTGFNTSRSTLVFSGISLFHPFLLSAAAPCSAHFTLIRSQDRDFKSCPNLCTTLRAAERNVEKEFYLRWHGLPLVRRGIVQLYELASRPAGMTAARQVHSMTCSVACETSPVTTPPPPVRHHDDVTPANQRHSTRVLQDEEHFLTFSKLPERVDRPGFLNWEELLFLIFSSVARGTAGAERLACSPACSIPGLVTPRFSYEGIVPDDAADRRVFSGICRSPLPILTSITLIGSQDPDVKSRPNLFNHSLTRQLHRDPGASEHRTPRPTGKPAGDKQQYHRPDPSKQRKKPNAVSRCGQENPQPPNPSGPGRPHDVQGTRERETSAGSASWSPGRAATLLSASSRQGGSAKCACVLRALCVCARGSFYSGRGHNEVSLREEFADTVPGTSWNSGTVKLVVSFFFLQLFPPRVPQLPENPGPSRSKRRETRSTPPTPVVDLHRDGEQPMDN